MAIAPIADEKIIPIEPLLAYKWLNKNTYWDLVEYEEPFQLIRETWRQTEELNVSPPHIKWAKIFEVRQEIRLLERAVEADEPCLRSRRNDLNQKIQQCQEDLRGVRDLQARAHRQGYQKLFSDEEKNCQARLNACERQGVMLEDYWSELEYRKARLKELREEYAKYDSDSDPYFPERPLLENRPPSNTYPLDLSTYLREGRSPSNGGLGPLKWLIKEIEVILRRQGVGTALFNIDNLERICNSLNDPRQTAEARLAVALLLWKMKEEARALKCLEQCLPSFRGVNRHAEALTHWIMGYIQWSYPTQTSEAIVNWRKCYEMFALNSTERRSTAHPRAFALWYDVRAEAMGRNLDFAIVHGRPPSFEDVLRPLAAQDSISPISPDSPLPDGLALVIPDEPLPPGANGARPSDELTRGDWLRLSGLGIYESILAHPAGGRVERKEMEVEINRLSIKNETYYLLSTKNSRVVRLNPNYRYDLVRVEGNSMDQAQPHPIRNDDYVLLRINPVPDDGQIVAAILQDHAKQIRATLKRKKDNGLHSESSQAYSPVPLTQVERYIGEVVAIVKPANNGQFHSEAEA